MNPLGILIKYYIYCVFLGIIFGFNQYAFQIKIPIYITSIITIIVLWGLIYNALKDSEARYSINELLVVMVGVVIPNSLALYLYPNFIGLSASSGMLLSFLSLVLGSAIIWGLFTMSKSMVLSAPIDDDYDS